jgi:sporulation integral membrane protein YlbJ
MKKEKKVMKKEKKKGRKFMKANFFVINIRKYFFAILFLIFLISLICFSNSNMQAAKNGLILWAESVVPSLFPFFVASDLLCKTNLIPLAGKYLGKIMKPIFNEPGESAIAVIVGTISGYPVGAKVVCKLVRENKISKEEAERLLAFCNNSGPLFILGTVGISLFGNKTVGYILLITHILASLSVGIIYKFWSPSTYTKRKQLTKNISNNSNKKDFSNITISNNANKKVNSNITTSNNANKKVNSNITISNLGEAIGNSITSSISSIMLVGGFIVIFSVILSIIDNYNLFAFLQPIEQKLNLPQNLLKAFSSGLLELTNGLKEISLVDISTIANTNFEIFFKFKILLSAALLRFWWHFSFIASF